MSAPTLKAVILQAFTEGYVNGVNHTRGRSVVLESMRIGEAFWSRVRDEAEREFPAASSSSTPLSETPTELVIPATEDHPAIYRDGHRLTAKKPSLAPLSETPGDTQRLNWLERRAEESEHVEINFTDAWSEPGDYGSVLSAGPRKFWLRDSGDESGPSLRAAIDAAMSSSLAPPSEPTSEGLND